MRFSHLPPKRHFPSQLLDVGYVAELCPTNLRSRKVSGRERLRLRLFLSLGTPPRSALFDLFHYPFNRPRQARWEALLAEAATRLTATHPDAGLSSVEQIQV